MDRLLHWKGLRSREMLLLVIFVVVIIVNLNLSPYFLGVDNLVNVFQNSIENAILALVMTLIIINGEIDLSVAAVMALCACAFGWFYQNGMSIPLAALLTLGVGMVCGAFNGVMIAYFGLPSLVVTLAGLVGYRGLGYVILEEKSAGNFPDWFNALGQSNIPGTAFPVTLLIFLVLFVVFLILLHFTAFGRRVYAVGNSREAARFAGIPVRRLKLTLFVISGLMSAIAALVYASRVGTVRADVANGNELDIITMVVLGGVSIFGGTGSLVGVGLSILIVLSLRNGMALASINGSVQTSIVGALLVLSLLIPNVFHDVRAARRREKPVSSSIPPRKEEAAESSSDIVV